jgi:hypothetical protein
MEVATEAGVPPEPPVKTADTILSVGVTSVVVTAFTSDVSPSPAMFRARISTSASTPSVNTSIRSKLPIDGERVRICHSPPSIR